MKIKILNHEHSSNFSKVSGGSSTITDFSIITNKKNWRAENSTQQKNISSSTFVNVWPSAIYNKEPQQDGRKENHNFKIQSTRWVLCVFALETRTASTAL